MCNTVAGQTIQLSIESAGICGQKYHHHVSNSLRLFLPSFFALFFPTLTFFCFAIMSFAPSPSLLKLYITLLLLTVVYADCQCGYTVDDTLYTDLIETDFLHLPNITTNTDWQAQNYTVTPELARGPYGKKALVENALANPLKSQFDWAGDGINGGDAGLQLIVRGGVPPDGLIPMAELATVRADLLYGSFRASMKVTETSGTCGAFFWVIFDLSMLH